MSETVRNWAGIVEIHPARVHRPGSVDELRRVVAAAESVRAFGTGHSFNSIAATDGDLVMTGGLPAQGAVHAAARPPTGSAGGGRAGGRRFIFGGPVSLGEHAPR